MMGTGQVNVQGAEATTREAVGPLLLRIKSSHGFSNCPRLSRLLDYLVEHSLAGETRELQEYAVGVEVFDRGPNFDPHSDTIVRVTARRLRERLSEYYQGPGLNDPLMLVIPKGHYRIEFQPRRHSPRRFHALLAACMVMVGIAVYIGLSDSGYTGTPSATMSPPHPTSAPGKRLSAAQTSVKMANHLFNRRGPGDVESALVKFNQALAVDPELVDAWVGIAGCLKILAYEGSTDFEQSLTRQETALTTALDLDPYHAEANMRMAYIYWTRGDIERSVEHRSRALETGSNSALVQSIAAGMYYREGDHPMAIARQRSAVALEPLSFVYQANLGIMLYQNLQLEEALKPLRAARILSPERGAELDADIARVLILLARFEEVADLVNQLPAGADRDQLRGMLAHAKGQYEEASAAIALLAARRGPAPSILLVEAYAFVDETDKAMKQLAVSRALIEQTREFKSKRVHYPERLLFSPFLQPLRQDPRWRQFWQSDPLAHLFMKESSNLLENRALGM